MNSLLRTALAIAALVPLAAAPAFADAAKLPLRGGDVASPSALAPGEQYLTISKELKCDDTVCSATAKGRSKRQTLITHVTCLTSGEDARIAYGAVTRSKDDQTALALLPVLSRTIDGTYELALVGGPTQIPLGPDDSVFFGVVGGGTLAQAICTLTGTTTKL